MTPGIIFSLSATHRSIHNLKNRVEKIKEFPINEIEVEADAIIQVKSLLGKARIDVTAMFNYPLAGNSPEYLMEAVDWYIHSSADKLCLCPPVRWIKTKEITRLSSFFKKIKDMIQQKTIRIAFESEIMPLKDVQVLCDLIRKIGFKEVKINSAYSHTTPKEILSFINKKYPELVIAVEVNDDEEDINNLISLGATNICLKDLGAYFNSSQYRR